MPVYNNNESDERVNEGKDLAQGTFNELNSGIQDIGNDFMEHYGGRTRTTGGTAEAGGAATDTAVETGAAAAEKSATSAASSATSATTTAVEASNSDTFAAVFALLLVICLIMPLLPTVLSNGTLAMNSSEETNREEKQSKLQEGLRKRQEETMMDIAEVLDTELDCGMNNDSTIEFVNKDENTGSYTIYIRSDDYELDGHEVIRACEVRVNFMQDAEEMTSNITSYTAAVDGAIAYYRNEGAIEEQEEDVDAEDGSDIFNLTISDEFVEKYKDVMSQLDEGSMFDSDEMYGLKYSEDAQKILKDLDGAQTDVGGEDAIEKLAKNAEQYFIFDTNPEHWLGYGYERDYAVEHIKKFFTEVPSAAEGDDEESGVLGRSWEELEPMIGEKIELENLVVTDEPEYPEDFEDEDGNAKTPWYVSKGQIFVPVYYSLQMYRAEDIQETVDRLEGKVACRDAEDDTLYACDAEHSLTMFFDLTNDYYKSYQEQFNNARYVFDGEVVENGNVGAVYNPESTEIEDFREILFSPILTEFENGYVPIYGIPSSGEGVLGSVFDILFGYSGDIGMGILGTFGTDRETWLYIDALIDAGIVTGAVQYNCTAYVAAWLYDHYGMRGVSLGNGKEFASNLIAHHGWKRCNTLTFVPGTVVSLGPTNKNPYGHVAVIVAVDYDRKTLVVSEGNYTANEAIQGTINTPIYTHTWSFAEWDSRVVGRGAVYAAPPDSLGPDDA